MPGATELVVVLVIVVLLFGASKIPALGRSVGEGLTNFKKALKNPEEPPQDPIPPREGAAREGEGRKSSSGGS
jgi:sec-independent protein translocase protein TatA